MNVFDFAMEMEKAGQVHYERLAAEASTAEFKNLFSMLATAEQAHYDALHAVKNGKDVVKADFTVLEKAKIIFQKLLPEKEDRGDLQADPDGYMHAIKAEEDSIKFYEEAAEKEQNEYARKLLLMLAEEEKEHLSIVENIYEFAEAPRTFLAWGEFSNLKEL